MPALVRKLVGHDLREEVRFRIQRVVFPDGNEPGVLHPGRAGKGDENHIYIREWAVAELRGVQGQASFRQAQGYLRGGPIGRNQNPQPQSFPSGGSPLMPPEEDGAELPQVFAHDAELP